MTVLQRYREVLGKQRNEQLLQLALDKRHLFTASRTTERQQYPHWRRSTVLYEQALAGLQLELRREIESRLAAVSVALGLEQCLLGEYEFQLTSHNDGEHYKWHTDNGSVQTASRCLTFVYYFHAEPKRFEGGELVIYEGGGSQPLVVEPENDSLVFFAATTRHEVRSVRCPSLRFEDSRFTLNGWIRKRDRRERHAIGPFGYDMLRWRKQPVRLSVPPGLDASAVRQGGQVPQASARPQPESVEQLRARADKAESLLRMYADLNGYSQRAGTIDEVSGLSNLRFVEDYYSQNRPFVMRGALASSPAVARWTPEYFASNFGEEPLQITSGRARDPDYERNFAASVETTTMGEFVRRIRAAGESNDLYLVARNHFFDRPAFASLRNDLQPPCEVVDAEDRRPGSAKLWMGPRGSITPLHHDQHSIFFMQIYGRKQFALLPAFWLPRLSVRDEFYVSTNLEQLRRDNAPLVTVELHPGDALFIPVGWWHHVRALDLSISATSCAFRVHGCNTRWK